MKSKNRFAFSAICFMLLVFGLMTACEKVDKNVVTIRLVNVVAKFIDLEFRVDDEYQNTITKLKENGINFSIEKEKIIIAD